MHASAPQRTGPARWPLPAACSMQMGMEGARREGRRSVLGRAAVHRLDDCMSGAARDASILCGRAPACCGHGQPATGRGGPSRAPLGGQPRRSPLCQAPARATCAALRMRCGPCRATVEWFRCGRSHDHCHSGPLRASNRPASVARALSCTTQTQWQPRCALSRSVPRPGLHPSNVS